MRGSKAGSKGDQRSGEAVHAAHRLSGTLGDDVVNHFAPSTDTWVDPV